MTLTRQNHSLLICLLAILVSNYAVPAWAQGGPSPLTHLNPFAEVAYEQSQGIMIFVAAIAIMGVGLLAFAGRFRWDIFIGAVGAIIVIAGGAAIINYYNQDNTNNQLGTDLQGMARSGLGPGEAIAYGIAGLGVLGCGVMAMMGRFRWSWFFSIIGGVVLIAALRLGFGFIAGVNNP